MEWYTTQTCKIPFNPYHRYIWSWSESVTKNTFLIRVQQFLGRHKKYFLWIHQMFWCNNKTVTRKKTFFGVIKILSLVQHIWCAGILFLDSNTFLEKMSLVSQQYFFCIHQFLTSQYALHQIFGVTEKTFWAHQVFGVTKTLSLGSLSFWGPKPLLSSSLLQCQFRPVPLPAVDAFQLQYHAHPCRFLPCLELSWKQTCATLRFVFNAPIFRTRTEREIESERERQTDRERLTTQLSASEHGCTQLNSCSRSLETYSAIRLHRAFPFTINSSSLLSTSSRQWKLPSPTWPTIGPAMYPSIHNKYTKS